MAANPVLCLDLGLNELLLPRLRFFLLLSLLVLACYFLESRNLNLELFNLLLETPNTADLVLYFRSPIQSLVVELCRQGTYLLVVSLLHTLQLVFFGLYLRFERLYFLLTFAKLFLLLLKQFLVIRLLELELRIGLV